MNKFCNIHTMQVFGEDKSLTSTLSAELGSGITSDVKAALKKEVDVFERREKLVRDIKVIVLNYPSR